MKYRITLSIALVLGVAFLSLMSSDSTANAAAAAPQRYFADTGVITLGPNQLLRITVAPAANSGRGVANVTFSNHVYANGPCSDTGVCIHTVASETTTDPVRLTAGEGASIDITQTHSSGALRNVVSMDRPDMAIDFLIIDSATGAINGHVKVFNGATGGL